MKILILILILLISCTENKKSFAVRSLPKSATEVQEFYKDTGFSGDFLRIIKAKLPKEDFKEYAKNLKLKEEHLTDKIEHPWDQIYKGPTWKESEDFDECYLQVEVEKEFMMRLKWKNGYIYLAISSW